MGIERVPNWESILNKKILEAKNSKFEYGKNDCTTWTADVVKNITTGLRWEPYWKTEREAIKLRKKKPMEDYVSEVLGEPNNNLLLTQRGDVVQRGLEEEATLGICIGRKVVFLMQEGICYYDLTDCNFSWRV